ncbi:tetratricopeptide repeat protein [Corallococcus sp. AB049A]|uniref:Tetratricopeptide repeat protein n=1 Tax=Corallococcus interemptor TaxID=2316720 RepID=A0A3A8QLW9_9BACT|nr:MULTISPECIES: tetratricopeptide repeat protein [Corallococcus]RKH69746.1 tetratricopeptide repeat protein [Corallococcus interemptor]RKI61408.1 tetratricopeptide repeat protein [Corallococcus sp. AB049A]
MTSISDETHQRITDLCAQGDAAAGDGDFEQALKHFKAALALIPEPTRDHQQNTWVRAAIGDMYFQLERFEDCREHFREAVHSPGGLGNPFIHLRLGQSALELGDETRAADELARAFMGGGEELFEGDDAKYLEFIQSRLNPPQDA